MKPDGPLHWWVRWYVHHPAMGLVNRRNWKSAKPLRTRGAAALRVSTVKQHPTAGVAVWVTNPKTLPWRPAWAANVGVRGPRLFAPWRVLPRAPATPAEDRNRNRDKKPKDFQNFDISERNWRVRGRFVGLRAHFRRVTGATAERRAAKRAGWLQRWRGAWPKEPKSGGTLRGNDAAHPQKEAKERRTQAKARPVSYPDRHEPKKKVDEKYFLQMHSHQAGVTSRRHSGEAALPATCKPHTITPPKVAGARTPGCTKFT